MPGPATGKHLADGLSRLIADTVVKARAATAPGEAAVKHQYQTAFLEGLEREMAPHAEAIVGWMKEFDSLPPEFRAMLDEVTQPGHQFAALEQILMFTSFLITIATRAGAPRLQQFMNELWAHSPAVPLSAADAADAVVRGVMDAGDGASEALKTGYGADAFGHLVGLAGNPPGPEELLAFHRRGLIDLPRLIHGIRQSRIKDEWVDVYTGRFTDPLDVGSLVAAAVQSQIDYSQAAGEAVKSGVSADDFATLYKTHGNPPGPEAVVQMLHRGILSQADAEQAIRESRTKNKYVRPLIEAGRRIPPERSVIMMVVHGAITSQDATARLLKLGFNAEDAAALISEGLNRKHAKTRDLAQTTVLELYTESSIDEPQAAAMLQTLGYDPKEAAWLIGLAETQRDRHFQTAAISKVHTLYVGHKIDRAEAGTDLDSLHVPPAQRNRFLTVWDIERTSNVAHLTLTQLIQAAQATLLTVDEFKGELARMGYTDKSIDILIKLHLPTQ